MTDVRRSGIPDMLSLLRLLLSVPLFFLLYLSDCRDALAAISAFLILLMIATDYLDGTLARKQGCVSMRGASRDIAADIAMALSASLALSANGTISVLVFISMAVFAVQFPLTSEAMKPEGKVAYDRLGTLAGMSCIVFPLAVLISENIGSAGLTGCCQAAMVVLCIAGTANRLRRCCR